MKSVAFASLFALTFAICGTPAQAVEIPITNFSFETPDAAGAWVTGVPDGWMASAGLADVFVEDTASVGMSGGDGIQFAGMDSNAGPGGYIYQDLGVTFKANTAYRVDIAGAHREGFGHGILEFGVFSSDAIGTDLGNAGFIDLPGINAGNPDSDGGINVFRDASELQTVGSGALGRRSLFNTGATPPTGNIVVFIRDMEQGRLNFDDIRLDEGEGFVAGDVDGDGDVDLTDYAEIRDNFRQAVTMRSEGDLNEDGRVDFDDFIEWRANHPFPGAVATLTNGAQAVPEPATMVLAALAMVGLAVVGKSRR